MIINLAGRTAIVTGSTDGIGRAIAMGLARAGANVVLNGRDAGRTQAAVEELQRECASVVVRGTVADLGVPEGTSRIIAENPDCDILVNNVAVNHLVDFLECPDALFYELFELNFMAAMRLSRAYLPGMLTRNRGRILFSGTQMALLPAKQMTPYAASKAAQLNFARALAEYTRGTAVTVNTVIIGPTHSAVTRRLHSDIAAKTGRSVLEVEAGFIRSHFPNSLLQRIATAEEVASLFIYLCSDQASATNGAALSAEGGTREVVV